MTLFQLRIESNQMLCHENYLARILYEGGNDL